MKAPGQKYREGYDRAALYRQSHAADEAALELQGLQEANVAKMTLQFFLDEIEKVKVQGSVKIQVPREVLDARLPELRDLGYYVRRDANRCLNPFDQRWSIFIAWDAMHLRCVPRTSKLKLAWKKFRFAQVIPRFREVN